MNYLLCINNAWGLILEGWVRIWMDGIWRMAIWKRNGWLGVKRKEGKQWQWEEKERGVCNTSV